MIKHSVNKDQLPDLSLIQKHYRGLLFLIVVIMSVFAMIYSTMSWMWDAHRLPLSKLVLQGHMQYVTAQNVQDAFSHIDHIGTFMSQDINVLQNAVQSIPWVEHASIRKQWPDTIKVFLTEHQVQAIWNGNELLDEHGMVFNGDIGELKGTYVKLYGPKDTSKDVLSVWHKYSEEFRPLGLSISSIVLNDRHAWQVILDNGIRLELGKDSLDERVQRFISLYRYFGNKVDKISYIDLRYDTGAAVGWLSDQKPEQENTDDKNDR